MNRKERRAYARQNFPAHKRKAAAELLKPPPEPSREEQTERRVKAQGLTVVHAGELLRVRGRGVGS